MIFQEIVEFNAIVSDYMKLHPKAENPQNWGYVLTMEEISEFIKNSNGREIEFVISNDPDVMNGGYLRYIKD
jgi:hypothetical protein